MSGIVTIYATFADADEAARIARILVEEKLAACANVLGPIRSVYRWGGAVTESEEVAVFLKTAAVRADACRERLEALHSYDVPCAVVWPIAGVSDAYRIWVEEA